MNRLMRRKFNKRNKTNYSRADFEMIEMLQKLKTGQVGDADIEKLSMLQDSKMTFTYNEEKVSVGREVKLNYDEISVYSKEMLNPKYTQWIEQYKDEIFHIAEKESDKYLTLVEHPLTNERGETTRWTFNATELLYKNEDGSWVDFTTAFPFNDKISEEQLKNISKNA